MKGLIDSTIVGVFLKQKELFVKKFKDRGLNLSEGFVNKNLVHTLSPGRVNIIGEHTDYNYGLAISTAIDKYIFITGARNDSNFVEVYSKNLDDYQKFSLSNIVYDTNVKWVNYVRGVVREYLQHGHKIGGFSIVIDSNLPSGAGISSSAALEVGVGKFLEEVFQIEINTEETVRYCNAAENNFVGVKCGFLDQMTVAYGKKDHAIFINFKDLSYEYIPFKLGSSVILIIDSKEERNLSETEYNKRGEECAEAVRQISLLAKDVNIKTLSDVNLNLLSRVEDKMDKKLFRRARHVVTENERVREAKKAIIEGDMKKLGLLLLDSHASLRDDYEVSTERLNFLVEEITKIDGVYGARLMGAGFGGNVISIVEKASMKNVTSILKNKFRSRFGEPPGFIECLPSDGTKRAVLDFGDAPGANGKAKVNYKKSPCFKGMSKRTVVKSDGRYLIYYTFGDFKN